MQPFSLQVEPSTLTSENTLGSSISERHHILAKKKDVQNTFLNKKKKSKLPKNKKKKKKKRKLQNGTVRETAG